MGIGEVGFGEVGFGQVGFGEVGIGWDSAKWESAKWDSAKWDSAKWESAKWDSAKWESAKWDSAKWESAKWVSAKWDSAKWDSAKWDSAKWEDTEIWGYQDHPAIEKVQCKFLKRLLGLSQSTSNIAVYDETGRLPLASHYHVRCFKYWLKLLSMPDHRYPKRCYLLLKQHDMNGGRTGSQKLEKCY